MEYNYIVLTNRLSNNLKLSNISHITDKKSVMTIKKSYYELLIKRYEATIVNQVSITKEEDKYNLQNGYIIIARQQEKVIGGARLTLSSHDGTYRLPLETDHFSLVEKFPNLDLSNSTYAEWSRFVVEPTIPEKRIIAENITRNCVNISLMCGINYLFGIPILAMKKRYEEIFARMGLNFSRIEQAPPIHPYIKVKYYLSVVDLRNPKCAWYPLLPHILTRPVSG